MYLRVLGSAAGGGSPQWNCGCANCVGLRGGHASLQPRTQASAAVSADGQQCGQSAAAGAQGASAHGSAVGETLLLYPEHGLVLNQSAAAILRLCDGRSAGDIATELGAPLADVLELLTVLSERGLVKA